MYIIYIYTQVYLLKTKTKNDNERPPQVKMMAPNKPGTVKLDVFVKSDSYIGLDQQKAVEFQVICAGTLPQYEPHPDDLELDNEPTLFEQVMQQYDDETDSEDEVSPGT